MSSFWCWRVGSACDVTAGRLRHRGVFPPLFAGVRRRGGGSGGQGRAGLGWAAGAGPAGGQHGGRGAGHPSE